ncbi:MAG: hypothetical protein IH946_09100, partial [Bacteroidetes bacterium]|nr:hypothetical protein [Bacteroidota bacterium]
HVKDQAEKGFKYLYGSKPFGKEDSFKLYFNEVIHTDNVVLTRMDDSVITFLTSNGLNLLSTTSTHFYDSMYEWLKILLSKSTIISGSSEKERNRVFLQFNQRIDTLIDTIKKN